MMKSIVCKKVQLMPPSGIRAFFDLVLGMKDVISLGVGEPAVLVADAYFAAAKVIGPLLRSGWHLIAAVRSNAVAYHFWMRAMKPRPRRSGDQYLHKESEGYRNAVRRKLRAYHCHIQLGVIAQGLLQAVAILDAPSVWRGFGSWLRTVRADVPPSERVVALALRDALPEFLADSLANHILAKFIRQRLDLSRAEGLRLAS